MDSHVKVSPWHGIVDDHVVLLVEKVVDFQGRLAYRAVESMPPRKVNIAGVPRLNVVVKDVLLLAISLAGIDEVVGKVIRADER